MAKAARGLPDNFALDLPDDRPVEIGDFLDEAPPPFVLRPRKEIQQPAVVKAVVREEEQRPAVSVALDQERRGETLRPVGQRAQTPNVIRYQLNLSPSSKKMLEDFVEHVQTYSPENDARASEVIQGIVTLLHNAVDELDLSDLPRRGAWGSVTAKNFPGALSEVFERAIVRAARKRGATA